MIFPHHFQSYQKYETPCNYYLDSMSRILCIFLFYIANHIDIFRHWTSKQARPDIFMTMLGLTVSSFCTQLRVGVFQLIGQILRCNTDTYMVFLPYVCARVIACWPFVQSLFHKNGICVLQYLCGFSHAVSMSQQSGILCCKIYTATL